MKIKALLPTLAVVVGLLVSATGRADCVTPTAGQNAGYCVLTGGMRILGCHPAPPPLVIVATQDADENDLVCCPPGATAMSGTLCGGQGQPSCATCCSGHSDRGVQSLQYWCCSGLSQHCDSEHPSSNYCCDPANSCVNDSCCTTIGNTCQQNTDCCQGICKTNTSKPTCACSTTVCRNALDCCPVAACLGGDGTWDHPGLCAKLK